MLSDPSVIRDASSAPNVFQARLPQEYACVGGIPLMLTRNFAVRGAQVGSKDEM